MQPEQIAHELNEPDARRLLTEAPLLRLAYDGLDGHPVVIPIGFLWNGSRLVVCTATMSPKVQALEARAQVAVTIDEGSTPAEAKALLVRGTARLETVDGVPDEFLEASAKTLPADQRAEFEAQARATYPQMVRISIEPAWARFYDFGAGRMPGFLQELGRR